MIPNLSKIKRRQPQSLVFVIGLGVARDHQIVIFIQVKSPVLNYCRGGEHCGNGVFGLDWKLIYFDTVNGNPRKKID